MEIVIGNRNYEEINRIIVGFVESYLNINVEYSTYNRIGTDTQLITIDTEEPILEKDKKNIMKLVKKINYYSKFLYKGFDTPIKQLKSLNKEYEKIKNYKDVYYYIPEDFTEELIEFAIEFIKMFSVNYQYIDLSNQLIGNTIILEKVGLIAGNLENKNGRLYITIDGEKHHMDYEKLSKKIYEKMKYSTLDRRYKIENALDSKNILRMNLGESPISEYVKGDNKHRFMLTLAFMKLCKMENLPMNNSKDIMKFGENVTGFEYYSIKTLMKLKREYESIEMSYYKEHEYEYMENALSFSIYLSGFNIKHLVFYNKDYNSYTVCYNYDSLLEPYVNIDDMKRRVIDYYTEAFQDYKDAIDNKKFKHMSIQELLNCVLVRDNILFDKHNIQHINPYDNKPLPLLYYEVRNYQKYAIYNIGNIVKGILKSPPIYNRDNLKVRDATITIQEGIVKIEDVEVGKNMFFTKNRKAMIHIRKMWKKGYFLNSFGLMHYLETGEFAKQCIRPPEWFSFKDSNEEDFFLFLKFNDL